jgi:hypothetical protein
MSWSPTLFQDLAPSEYHLLPGLKEQFKFRHYSSTRRSLLPRGSGGTDNILNFLFEWLA